MSNPGSPTLTRLPVGAAESFVPVMFVEVTRATLDAAWAETSDYLTDLAETLNALRSPPFRPVGSDGDFVSVVGNVDLTTDGLSFLYGIVHQDRAERLYDASMGRWDDSLDLLLDETLLLCGLAIDSRTLSVAALHGDHTLLDPAVTLSELLDSVEQSRGSAETSLEEDYRPVVWWFVDNVIDFEELDRFLNAVEKITLMHYGVHLPNPSPRLPGAIGGLFDSNSSVHAVELRAEADARTAALPTDDRSVVEFLRSLGQRLVSFFRLGAVNPLGDALQVSSIDLRLVIQDELSGSVEETVTMLHRNSVRTRKAS